MNLSIHSAYFTLSTRVKMLSVYSMQFVCYEIMRKHFLAPHPLIGTKHKPSKLSQQQRSPYYWWWAYLKRNKDYLKCCDNGGKGKLAKLYEDFGDARGDDFPSWWGRSYQRGQDLFSEATVDVRVLKLNEKSDWQDDWADNNITVVAVNMDIGKRALQRMFSKLLLREHKGTRGRKSFSNLNSTAKYPLHRNLSLHSIITMLAVYDKWLENSQLPKPDRKPLWEIGDELRLIPSQISRPTDDKIDRTVKHNIMTATVSRYVKNAKAIIANTAKGQFPNSSVD
jgi:hypothetical protein